jgi:RNA polymerase sigma-70 factor (ECF subfamily)
VHDEPTAIDSRHVARETAARVARALADLPAHERDAIVRAYYGGASYRDVAFDTGTAEGTIKARIRSGLRRLRSTLKESDTAGAGR